MSRARDLADLGNNAGGLETLTVSDITDLSVSASNINSATNQITDSSTDLNVDSNTLVVDKSENKVGIMTNSPAVELEVKGSGNTDGTVRASYDSSYYADYSVASIKAYRDNSTASNFHFGMNSIDGSAWSSTGGNITFFTNDSGSYEEKVRINTSGDVTIPSGILQGGIGAITTGGTTNWNHDSNAISGSGRTLLLGSASNGPGGGSYYHPFTFEYSAKNGTGNMTQTAWGYNNNLRYMRWRYNGTWSSWYSF